MADKHMNLESLQHKVEVASAKYHPRAWHESRKFVQDSHKTSRFRTALSSKGKNAILDHIQFCVGRQYLKGLLQILPNMKNIIDPIQKNNVAFLKQQLTTSLYVRKFQEEHNDPNNPDETTKVDWLGFDPTSTTRFNIRIPIFNLGTKATNIFAKYDHDVKGFGDSNNSNDRSYKLNRQQIIDMARSTYQIPRNLLLLCLSANFIFPIGINPIPDDSGIVKPAPSTDNYRYIDGVVDRVNKTFAHKPNGKEL